MKFYRSSTEYNCGIDLHSRHMYICLECRSIPQLYSVLVR